MNFFCNSCFHFSPHFITFIVFFLFHNIHLHTMIPTSSHFCFDLKTICNILNIHHSVQFNHSVMSDSLQLHGWQHTRLPCPPPTPRAYSKSGCHVSDDIQWSHPLSSPSPAAFNLSQHQGVFKWVSSLHQVPKDRSFSFSICPSNEYSGLISFRMDWLDLLAVQGTQESSPTPQFKSINSLVLSFLYSSTLTSIHDHWKNHSLD